MDKKNCKDTVNDFKNKIIDTAGRLDQLKEDKKDALERSKDVAINGMVPRLMSILQEKEVGYIAQRNEVLQGLLESIDSQLTEGKQFVERVHEFRSCLVAALNRTTQQHVQEQNIGEVAVKSALVNDVLESFNDTTMAVMTIINKLRLKPDVILSFMEDKITALVEKLCSELEQKVQASCAVREARQEGRLQKAQQELDHTVYLLEKMTGLGGQLKCWVDKQHRL